jgi:hypothetical protein
MLREACHVVPEGLPGHFFRDAFQMSLDVPVDLDGIVYKRKDSPYKVTEKLSCYLIKIKNSRYSQCNGVKNSLNAFEAS